MLSTNMEVWQIQVLIKLEVKAEIIFQSRR